VTEASGATVQLIAESADGDGRIEDVFYRPGEWAPANQPVVSLLPDERVRVRFFVPETSLPAYKPGEAGCGSTATAAGGRRRRSTMSARGPNSPRR
jgi:HlyD family secretion protein